MPSLDQYASELNATIKGFLVPIFSKDLENGQRLNGLGPDDYQKVMEGYACPECLAEYVTYLVTCPVCRYQRDPTRDILDAPRIWTDHLANRENPPPPVEARDFDTAMADKGIVLPPRRRTRKR
jgi:hypothetical protein